MIKVKRLLLLMYTIREFRCFDFDGNFLREIALDAQTYSVAFTESGDLLSFVARVDRKLPLYTEGGQFIQYISR